MRTKTYSIGELARLSGTPVRRIRFYSDKGLLPPSARTDGNYRLYTNMDLARLDLIRALRAAGVELSQIARVIARRLPLAEVLRARLGILEREMSAQARVAAAIRATLSLPQPTEDDFRRVLMMMALSNAEMQAKVRAYVDSICEGSVINERNRRRLIEFTSCELPDNPSLEQLEAWQRIAALLDDEDLRELGRTNIRNLYHPRGRPSDPARYTELLRRLEEAQTSGMSPSAVHVQELARDLLLFEAEIDQVDEAAIIERRIFHNECAKSGRSVLALRTLCNQVKGIGPVEGRRWPPTEFWNWFHAVLLARREQALPVRPVACDR